MKKTILFLFINLIFINFISAQIKIKEAKDSLNIVEQKILQVLENRGNAIPGQLEVSALNNLKLLDSMNTVLSNIDPKVQPMLSVAQKTKFDEATLAYKNFAVDLGVKIRRKQFVAERLKELSAILEDNENRSDITNDIYNPINFTTILHRKPAENGVAASNILYNRASRHFIKKEGVLHLKFDKNFVKYLTLANKLNIRIKAFVQRTDGSIKPLPVLGLTNVVSSKTSDKEKILNNSDDSLDVEDSYQITYQDSGLETISAEIAVPFEEISIDDTIIVEITNQSVNGVGFISKFVFAEYGWTQGPTGGFSFVQTIEGDDNIFRAAGSAGYAFRCNPKPSAEFWKHFFYPSFGPELNVLQKNDETLIGLGVFVSTAANSVKIGLGSYLNGESNKAYVAIGLNFIEGYNKISELLNRVQ